MLAGYPVAALAGVAALLVMLLGVHKAANSSADSPAAIQALVFVKQDGYITVIIRNPYADAGSDEITTITKPGSCQIDGATCTIGFKVPIDFHGQASIGIGRPARRAIRDRGLRPQPRRGSDGPKDEVYGHPLSQVLPLLAQHHVTIAVLRDPDNNTIDPSQAPGNWYIENVTPWARTRSSPGSARKSRSRPPAPGSNQMPT